MSVSSERSERPRAALRFVLRNAVLYAILLAAHRHVETEVSLVFLTVVFLLAALAAVFFHLT